MEYLPLGRIAALVPEFAVKDLPLGRTLINNNNDDHDDDDDDDHDHDHDDDDPLKVMLVAPEVRVPQFETITLYVMYKLEQKKSF